MSKERTLRNEALERLAKTSAEPTALAAESTAPTAAEATSLTAAEPVAAEAAPAVAAEPAPSASYELHLGSGAYLKVSSGYDRSEVRSLLQMLARTGGGGSAKQARAAEPDDGDTDASPKPYTWFKTNSPAASSRTDDIVFLTPDLGWLVNSNGQIARTDDGGESWTIQYTIPPGKDAPYLRTIGFANEKVGWAGTLPMGSTAAEWDPTKPLNPEYAKNLLLKTVDGGTTWEKVDNLPADAPGGACGMSVVDEKTVFITGSNDPAVVSCALLKTTDGGESWKRIDMTPWATTLIDCHFFDAKHGWAVGGLQNDRCPAFNPAYNQNHPQYGGLQPVVLETTDGGETWQNRAADIYWPFCGEWGWKIFWLPERTIGFVSLENFGAGAILRTDDGGRSWRRLPINDSRDGASAERPTFIANANLEGVGFIDALVGWVGGWGDAGFIGTYNSYTEDGGATWTAEDSTTGGDPRTNVNRYVFFGDPVTVGYCSGVRVYKMLGAATDATGSGGSEPGSKATAAEPGPAKTDGAEPASSASAVVGADQVRKLDLRGTTDGDQLEVTFTVPESGQKVYLGVWSHFGWHLQTLSDTELEAGTHRFVWDGTTKDGRQIRSAGVILRVAVGNECESAMAYLA